MEEIWKDVVGWGPAYKVSNLGNVMSCNNTGRNGIITGRKPRILKPFKDRGGYVNVRLCNNKIEKTRMIHRLVAMAFIPNPENKEQVNHKDSNRANNHVDNLEWVSRRENITHGGLKRRAISQYLGVTKDGRDDRWSAKIQINKKSIFLGRFKTELQAHEAFQKL